MDQLPLEVVITIFSKATFKTLLQCRRVCKSWLAALSDPETLKTSIKLPKCLVLHVDPNDSTPSSNSRFVYLYDHRTVPSSDNAILKLASKVTELNSVTTELVGSCNGLLCWCRKEPTGETGHFRITISNSNPLTGDCLAIPASTDYIPHRTGLWSSKWEAKIGFGYIASKKQYKLVHLVTKKRSSELEEAKVLTIGTGTWKCLKCPYGHVSPKFGVHANGAIHWIGSGATICSLDLESDRFNTLPFPCSTRSVSGVYVIKDRLTVWTPGSERIWTLIEGSWVELKKAARFLHEYMSGQHGFLRFERPLVFYPKKKSLVLCRDTHHQVSELYVCETQRNDIPVTLRNNNSLLSLACGHINEAISGFEPTFVSIQHLLNGA